MCLGLARLSDLGARPGKSSFRNGWFVDPQAMHLPISLGRRYKSEVQVQTRFEEEAQGLRLLWLVIGAQQDRQGGVRVSCH